MKCPKVRTIQPVEFEDFKGVSYLFDNPGRALAETDGLECIDCDLNDPNLVLYAGLADATLRLKTVLDEFQFCELPPRSFHGTVCDGVNQSNVPELIQPARAEFETYLKKLPESALFPREDPLPTIFMTLDHPWVIRFRFKKFHIWPSAAAMVALLEPANPMSEWVLEQIRALRCEIDQRLVCLGKSPNLKWTPHISLGYFLTTEQAEGAKRHVDAWTDQIVELMRGREIEFSSMSLYSFTNMTKFWRCGQPAVRVRLPTVCATIAAGVGRMGQRGAQKISISRHWSRVERLSQVDWLPVAPNGKENYHITRNIDVAVFDQRAVQDGHLHKQATEFYTVLDGQMSVRVGGTSYLLGAGDTIVIYPDADHEIEPDQNFIARVISANCSGLEDKFKANPGSALPCTTADALVIRKEILQQKQGRLLEAGQQKILIVSECRAEEVTPPPEVVWRPLTETGGRPVQRTSNFELAVFDHLAKQDRHFHRIATEAYWVIDGVMTIEIEGTTYRLAAGDMIMVSPRAVHEVKPDTPFLAQVLSLNSAGLADKYVPNLFTKDLADAEQAPRIAVVTTPRRDSAAGVRGFLEYVRLWRKQDPRISAAVIAMPSRTSEAVRQEILSMLQAGEYLGEMCPEAQGVGSIFQFAVEYSLGLDPGIKWVLHLPEDVTWDSTHAEDVQARIKDLADPSLLSVSDLALGDYHPMLWNNGRAVPHTSKLRIELHVMEQLKHYGLGDLFTMMRLERVRTEFFIISRALFESVTRAYAWAPFDPIPGIVLHAQQKHFRVKRVPLGMFYEANARPTASSIRGQVIRTALQIVTEYLRREHTKSPSATDFQSLTERWNRTVNEGMDKAFDAVRNIVLLQATESILGAFGWFKQGPVSTLAECGLAALARQREQGGSLVGIIPEVLTMPSFAGLDPMEVILALAGLKFDKELLVLSRKKRCAPLTTESLLGCKPMNAPTGGDRPVPLYGLSLVLFYDQPESLKSALDTWLKPIRNRVEVPLSHCTLVNLANEIPEEQINDVRNTSRDRLREKLAGDAELRTMLASLIQVAAVRTEMLVHDNSLVQFGSGPFLEILHSLRLRLVTDFLLEPDWATGFPTAHQPVWMHSVVARLMQPLAHAEESQLGDWPPPHLPQTIKLARPRVGLMTFQGKTPKDELDLSELIGAK